jgi:hypothetical protein
MGTHMDGRIFACYPQGIFKSKGLSSKTEKGLFLKLTEENDGLFRAMRKHMFWQDHEVAGNNR